MPTRSDDALPIVYVVIAGSIVFDAYTNADSGELHARTLTGGKSIGVRLRESVPRSVLEDIQTEFDSDVDDETPVDQAVPSRRARATDPRWDLSDMDNGSIRRRR